MIQDLIQRFKKAQDQDVVSYLLSDEGVIYLTGVRIKKGDREIAFNATEAIEGYEMLSPTEINKNILAILDRYIKKYGFTQAKVFFVLQEKDALLRTILAPRLSKKEMEQSVKYELKHALPYKLEEIVYQITPFDYKKVKKTYILFLGALGKRLQVFLPSKLPNRFYFLPPAIAIFNIARFFASEAILQNHNDVAVVVYKHTQSHYTLSIINRELPLFTREIYDREDIPREIKISFDYLKKQMKEDFSLKKVFFFSMDPEEVSSIGEMIGLRVEVKNLRRDLLPFGIPEPKDPASLLCYSALLVPQGRFCIDYTGYLHHLDAQRKQKARASQASLEKILEKIDSRYVFLIGTILIGLFALRLLNINGKANELIRKKRSIIAKLPRDVFQKPEGVSETQIREEMNRLNANLAVLDRMKKNVFPKKLSKFLDFLANKLPEDMWISLPFIISRDLADGKVETIFEAFIMSTPNQSVYRRLDKINEDIRKDFGDYFTEIKILAVNKLSDHRGEYFGVKMQLK